MENKFFSTNISFDEVERQYAEAHSVQEKTKKTQFDKKNYLQARLNSDENSKTLTIRLLPITPDSKSCFQRIHMHTVRVNKDVSSSGWKTFVCPTKNKLDGEPMGEKCPFCNISAKARELRNNASDEQTRKKYNDIEFLNRAKDMWVARCIERGHEEDGVKFWLFPDNKQGQGVYEQIRNLANVRREAAARKGNEYNIYDVNNGLDFIVTINRTNDGKTKMLIVDSGIPSPITEDHELGEKWINDEKKWYEVFTVKPYDYMSIVAEGGVPVFDKELNKYVDKNEMNKAKEEAERQRIEENLMEDKKDYSEIPITDKEPSNDNSEESEEYEDLPF